MIEKEQKIRKVRVNDSRTIRRLTEKGEKRESFAGLITGLAKVRKKERKSR